MSAIQHTEYLKAWSDETIKDCDALIEAFLVDVRRGGWTEQQITDYMTKVVKEEKINREKFAADTRVALQLKANLHFGSICNHYHNKCRCFGEPKKVPKKERWGTGDRRLDPRHADFHTLDTTKKKIVVNGKETFVIVLNKVPEGFYNELQEPEKPEEPQEEPKPDVDSSEFFRTLMDAHASASISGELPPQAALVDSMLAMIEKRKAIKVTTSKDPSSGKTTKHEYHLIRVEDLERAQDEDRVNKLKATANVPQQNPSTSTPLETITTKMTENESDGSRFEDAEEELELYEGKGVAVLQIEDVEEGTSLGDTEGATEVLSVWDGSSLKDANTTIDDASVDLEEESALNHSDVVTEHTKKKRKRSKKSKSKDKQDILEDQKEIVEDADVEASSTSTAFSAEAIAQELREVHDKVFELTDETDEHRRPRYRLYIQHHTYFWRAIKSFENNPKAFEDFFTKNYKEKLATISYDKKFPEVLLFQFAQAVDYLIVYTRDYSDSAIEEVYKENNFGDAEKEACKAHIDQLKTIIRVNKLDLCLKDIQKLAEQLDPFSWYFVVKSIAVVFRYTAKKSKYDWTGQGALYTQIIHILGAFKTPERWPEDTSGFLERNPSLAEEPEEYQHHLLNPETPLGLRLRIERQIRSAKDQS